MPVGPLLRGRTSIDAPPIYRLGAGAMRPVFREVSGGLQGARTWNGALARLIDFTPPSITGQVAPGIRDRMQDIDQWHFLRFRKGVRRFAGDQLDNVQRLGGFGLQQASLRATGYMERMPANYVSNLQRRLQRLQQQGRPFSPAALRRAVAQSQHAARTRIRLIAVDQVETFVGQLNRRRQLEVGVEMYEWRTAGDDRVRPEHAANDGQTFLWNDAPATGHPGEAIRCRCSALPVFASRLRPDLVRA